MVSNHSNLVNISSNTMSYINPILLYITVHIGEFILSIRGIYLFNFEIYRGDSLIKLETSILRMGYF